MPLILAIEPDRRQASQLTAMVRGRLHAELVLADTAERALHALGDRVPDLVLTSALLSPKDDAALADRLRALDGQASYVQTLTIPVLATGSSRGGGRGAGMLAALRRDKNKPSTTEGCDPAVFAEQCRDYLDRAATERAALADQAASVAAKQPVRPVSPSPVTGSEWVVVRESAPSVESAPAVASEPVEDLDSVTAYVAPRPQGRAPMYVPPEYRSDTPVTATDLEPDSVPSGSSEAAAESSSTPSGTDEPVFEPRIEPLVSVPLEPEAPVVEHDQQAARADRLWPTDRGLREFFDLDNEEGPASLLAAVAALEAEEHNSFSASAYVPDNDQVDEAGDEDAHPNQTVVMTPAGPQFIDLSSLLEPPITPTETVSTAPGGEHAADVYEIDATLLDPAFGESPDDPVSEPTSLLASLSDLDAIFKAAPEFRPAAPAPQPASPAPLENMKEWEDIVEALRRDAERLEARPTPTSGPAPAHYVEIQQIVTPSETLSPADETDTAPIDAQAETVADPAESEAAVEPATTKPRRKRAKAVPPQDEWGFFDPDQCGFAALIEKLEEVTDKDDKPAPRGA